MVVSWDKILVFNFSSWTSIENFMGCNTEYELGNLNTKWHGLIMDMEALAKTHAYALCEIDKIWLQLHSISFY